MPAPEPDAIDALAARLGLRGPWARATGGLNRVYVGADAVIKVYPRCDAAEAAIEAEALAAIAGRLPLPTRVPLAHGDLGGEPYLAVTRLPGVPLKTRWPALSPPQRQAAARSAGVFLAALWNLPPPPKVRARRPDLRAWLDAEWDNTRARHLAEGVDPRLLDEIPAWVAAHPPRDDAPAAFLHADLHDENLLCDADGALCGALDLGDALVGPRAFDVVTPWLSLGAGDAQVREALLIGAGGTGDVDLRASLAPLALRHPWAELAPLGAFSDVEALAEAIGG